MAKDGGIYKRGNVYWIKYYRGGKPYYESTTSDKESEAKQLLRKRLGQISEGRFFGLRPERVKFEDLAQGFVNDYRINGKRSLDKPERSVRHLQHFFGSMRAIDITTDKVRAYISDRLDDGVANGEINRELAALKRMFNLALQQTPPKVPQKPYIPMLQEKNVRKGFFEHDEFVALRAALPSEIRPVVTFAYHTGWRKEEVLALTWDRVDLHARAVRLDPGTTKNDDGRLIYLDGELFDTLVNLKRERDLHHPHCPAVFYRAGKPIKDFRAAWGAACQAVGLEGKLFHDFRWTAVRNMVRAGIPERVAQQISGHKTRSVFDRYHIVSDSDLREAAKRQASYAEREMVTKTVTVDTIEQLWRDELQEAKSLKELVPEVGLEPTRRADLRGILSPVRLPIPPLRHQSFTRGLSAVCYLFSAVRSRYSCDRAGLYDTVKLVTCQGLRVRSSPFVQV
jgi:integrase